MSLYAAGSISESQEAWSQSCWQAASSGGQDVPKNKRGASPSSPFLAPSFFDGMLLKSWLHAEEGSDGSSRRRAKSRSTRRGEDALVHLDTAFERVRLDLRHAAEAGMLPADASVAQLHVLREARRQLQPAGSHVKKSMPANNASSSVSVHVLEVPAASLKGLSDQHPLLQLSDSFSPGVPPVENSHISQRNLATSLQMLQMQSVPGKSSKVDVCQQLCTCIQAAAQGSNWNLVKQLLQQLQSASSNQKDCVWSSRCQLLNLYADAREHAETGLAGPASSQDIVKLWQAVRPAREPQSNGRSVQQQQSAQRWPDGVAHEGLLLLYAWLEGYQGSEELAEALKTLGENNLQADKPDPAIHLPHHEGMSVIQPQGISLCDSADTASVLQYQAAYDAITCCKSSQRAWQAFAGWQYGRVQKLSLGQQAAAEDIASMNFVIAMDYAHSLVLDSGACSHTGNLHILLRILNSSEAVLKALSSEQQLHLYKLCGPEGLASSDSSRQYGTGKNSRLPVIEGGTASVSAALGEALAKIPSREWCSCLPQLFSKLTTSHEAMQCLVTVLLKRLIDAAPQSLLYPLLGMLHSIGENF